MRKADVIGNLNAVRCWPAIVVFLIAAGLFATQCAADQNGGDETARRDTAEAAELIKQLGDPKFAAREAATTRLAAMDVSVRPALQEAAKSRDAEVRSRARRILATVNERYFQERVAAFSADVDDKERLNLPGWSRYRSIAGKDRAARELFVEMLRAEPRILEATESKLASINELLSDRMREMFQPAQFGEAATLSGPSAAALLFVASDPQLQPSADVATLVNLLVHQQAVNSALKGSRGEHIKKLLEAWILRDTDDTGVLAHHVALTLNQNLSIGRDLAKTVLKKNDLTPHLAQQAMSLLARAGNQQDAVLLERFLKDEGVVGNFNPNDANREVLKVCDCAMAMMIHLTKNNPRDFRDGPLRWGQGWNAELQTLAFRTDEERKAALAKWDAWWQAHKGKLGDEKERAKE